MKTTLSINKLFKVLVLPICFSTTLYAQCPENISVDAEDDQCGAVVTYIVAGGGSAQSTNGVVNGSATNGLTGWNASNGTGTGWVVANGAFVSSYNVSTMSQVIDLTTMGMTDAYMDTAPAITVAENYMGTGPNFSDTYKLTVQLRGEADNIIATYTTGNVTTTGVWQTATHTFNGYATGVRKIYFEHTGDDVEFWAGNYGAAITNASVTIVVPTSEIVQTAGLASGEEFPIGTTTNTFTITDEDDTVTTCSFDVVVADTQVPVAIAQDFTAVLDEDGTVTITAEDIDNGSTDNCSDFTMELDVTEFTCEDLGENTVTLTVDDGTNTTTATAIVKVTDATNPVAVIEDMTLQIDAEGFVALIPEQVGENSTDNCGIASYNLDVLILGCEDIGENEVTLTVTDEAGNTDTATATITVQDVIEPTVITQNITLELPEVTIVSISAMDIDNGSFDNCGISSYSLDNQIFTCEDLGDNTVTLTITDNYGNTSTGTAIVTIVDTDNYCQSASLENATLKGLSVYPNPAQDVINFDAGNTTIDTIEIYDINARLIRSHAVNAAGSVSININALAPGMYLVKINNGDSFTTKGIIKD